MEEIAQKLSEYETRILVAEEKATFLIQRISELSLEYERLMQVEALTKEQKNKEHKPQMVAAEVEKKQIEKKADIFTEKDDSMTIYYLSLHSNQVETPSPQPNLKQTTKSPLFQISFNSSSFGTKTFQPKPAQPKSENLSLDSQEEQVDFLVIDTGAFINGVQVDKYSKELFSIPEVMNEVRDKFARDFVSKFPWEIKIREPSPEALRHVINFAKKTGDYPTLSQTDLKVIALSYMLEKEKNGTDHLRDEPLKNPKVQLTTETSKLKADFTTDWLTPTNIREVATKVFGEYKPLRAGKGGACITTDFAIQNVLMQMGIRLISVNGLQIRKVKQWVLKCFTCFKIIKDMDKVFCSHCGNNTLLRVPTEVNESGEVVILQDPRKQISTRGTIYTIPPAKGGKKSHDLIFTEDEYNRKVRRKKEKDLLDPEYTFAGDLHQQKTQVVVGYGKKNPNIARKKIGKKNKPQIAQNNY